MGEVIASPARSRFHRILLKLSGQALAPSRGSGIDLDAVGFVAQEVKQAVDLGVQTAMVIGGGNILRGSDYEARGMDRATADQMGMLATVINALALQNALEQLGVNTRVLSAINMQALCEPYIRRRAVRHLEKGRASDLRCRNRKSVLHHRHRREPSRDRDRRGGHPEGQPSGGRGLRSRSAGRPSAKRFDRLTYLEVIQRRLQNLQNPRWPGRDGARRPESRSKYIGSLPDRASVDGPDPDANMLLCAPLLTCLPL